ncbi:hypothetical protein FQN54_003283 [Arachnomyces sp. PD_36]|nr:hypothetical protein FQN54_003283 [Arachnomyces sp. PD_36]
MEKAQPPPEGQRAPPPPTRPCRFRRFLAAVLILSTVSAFFYFGPRSLLHPTVPNDDGLQAPTAVESFNKVPLEAHIMSRCPDAKHCLRSLIVPAMEQVHDKVDLGLSFIGRSNPPAKLAGTVISNDTSGVACMHGPAECVGNMLILCAANLPFPPTLTSDSSSDSSSLTPTIRSLGFANCLISSYRRIPERGLVEYCALEHGIDFDALNQCASRQDDDEGGGGVDEDPDKPSGIALLRRSIQRNLDANIKTSCTVRLDEQIWCVRDGGVWKDCVDDGQGSSVSVLVEEIERLSRERN